jgi:DNA-binding IscR family transcriptional regulator
MSIVLFSHLGHKRRGRARDYRKYVIALEVLMYPGKPPRGLISQIARANNVQPEHLILTIHRIKQAAIAKTRR